jgi:gamma-F420-2:alpha-L-glutamate ligase
MKKGVLIYKDSDYRINEEFAQRFVDKCGKFGLDIEIVLESRLSYGVKSGVFYFDYDGAPAFAVNRTRNHYLANVLERCGIKVFNGSAVTRLANDKAAAYLAAAGENIPCLNTYIYAKEYAANLRDFPAVIKQPYSHGGEKVFWCRSKSELKEALAKIDGGYAVAQSPLTGDRINDIRVYVCGNKILAAVNRAAPQGSFKANYKSGGGISLTEVDEVLTDYVNRFLKKHYYDFAGFDFLTSDYKNYYFNEIEDCVGSRALCILKDIDTSEILMRHISESV